jgi:hypothetical protein
MLQPAEPRVLLQHCRRTSPQRLLQQRIPAALVCNRVSCLDSSAAKAAAAGPLPAAEHPQPAFYRMLSGFDAIALQLSLLQAMWCSAV